MILGGSSSMIPSLSARPTTALIAPVAHRPAPTVGRTSLGRTGEQVPRIGIAMRRRAFAGRARAGGLGRTLVGDTTGAVEVWWTFLQHLRRFEAHRSVDGRQRSETAHAT